MSKDIAEEIRSSYRGSSVSRGEAFDRWLAEVKAQAWEEGLQAKFKRLENDDSVSLTNPYRGENK